MTKRNGTILAAGLLVLAQLAAACGSSTPTPTPAAIAPTGTSAPAVDTPTTAANQTSTTAANTPAPETTTAAVTPSATSTGRAKQTIMVYVAANNNLEPNSIINLMEMAAVGSTPDVNIVVQITRPPDYKGFYGEWGGTRRFLVTKSDGGQSSGDFQISPTRFASFLNTVGIHAGLTADQVAQITRANAQQEEQAALQLSVPVIEKQTPLTPLQLKDVQDLGGQVNSGDGATLASFGTWAAQTYPADHYGLIMWDHGGGWPMIASDDTLGPAGISMTGLRQALVAITTATGQKLDFVGFDACLMEQLPVAVTLQPYANYEIGAEELVPGFGWDYTPALQALVANPSLSAADFGKAEVDAFNALYTGPQSKAAQSFDLGVLDLSKIDGVVSALAAFDTAIKGAKGNDLKAVATARGNVQLFGSVGESPDATAAISSVDLSDFMRLMGSLSADSAVQQASKGVIQAVQQAVIYHKASASLPHAAGLSIFFPTDSATFSAADGTRYRTEFASPLPAWQDFLDTFYGVASGAAASSKPVLQVTKVSATDQHPGSIYDVPVISFGLNGQNLVGVTAYVIYQLNAQTNVVLDTFPVAQNVTTADGSQVNDYPDGQTSSDFYWNTKLPKLSDGTQSLFVLMTSNPKDQQHGFIQGQYTDKITGKQTNSSLLIDLDTYQSSGLWATPAAGQPSPTIAQITPKPGDTFEPIYRTIDASGAATDVLSGSQLVFGKDPLTVTNVPGPDGKYTVVLSSSDAAGDQVGDTASVNVMNTGLDASLQGFKDLGSGISFLYPWAWTDVSTYVRADGLTELDVSDVAGAQTLAAVNYAGVASLADVEAKVNADLQAISGVTLGATTAVTVGTNPGQSLAYQYTASDGTPIVGTAVAVYVASTRQGYQISVEAPKDQAAAIQTVLDGVLKTSQFFAPVQ